MFSLSENWFILFYPCNPLKNTLHFFGERPSSLRNANKLFLWTCHRKVDVHQIKLTFHKVQIQCRAINYLRDYPRIDPCRFDVVIQCLRLLFIRRFRDKVTAAHWRGMIVVTFRYLMVLIFWIRSGNDKNQIYSWQFNEDFGRKLLFFFLKQYSDWK